MTDKPEENSNINLPELFGISSNGDVTVDENLDKFPQDFHQARKSILETLDQTSGAAVELTELAHASQHPRFYEVLSSLLLTKVKAVETLMHLQRQARNIIVTDSNNNHKTVVNNAIFVGDTSELLSLINKNKK